MTVQAIRSQIQFAEREFPKQFKSMHRVALAVAALGATILIAPFVASLVALSGVIPYGLGFVVAAPLLFGAAYAGAHFFDRRYKYWAANVSEALIMKNALEKAEEALKVNRFDVQALMKRATVMHRKKKFKEADTDIQLLLKINPANPTVLGLHASCLLHSRKRTDALATINRALELAPNDPYLLSIRVRINKKLHQKDQVIQDLDALLRIDDKDLIAKWEKQRLTTTKVWQKIALFFPLALVPRPIPKRLLAILHP